MNKITINKTAAKGYGFGECFIVKELDITACTTAISSEEVAVEKGKVTAAMEDAKVDLEALAKTSAIFQAHLDVLDDPALISAIEGHIDNLNNAQLALETATKEICQLFDSLDDEYLKERAADIKDVSKRIMCKLKGLDLNVFDSINKEVIIIADDLTPSDTANMNFNFVKGLVTAKGGVTSHVAIIARQLKLPAMVGVSDILSNVKNDDYIVMDGIESQLYVNPDQPTIDLLKKQASDYYAYLEKLKVLINMPSETTDGHTVELCANVGSVGDVKKALQDGAEGVGLFRTELLYMDSDHFPTEEEQFIQYKQAILAAEAPMIVRTLDIGGDKSLPYFKFETEENPFLGYRAIRMCLDMKEKVFKPQLKALLRASAFGDIRIMYPMIISVEEFLESNKVLEECKAELKSSGIDFNANIQTGVMIETPAAVMLSNKLAEVVDFFSIGTNDLTQYILCVDRGNQKIDHLYNTFHPAVLNAIKLVIDNAHAHGKMVGVCGEFAADPQAVKILLGMGLDEFSMASSAILEVKKQVRELSFKDSQVFAQNICNMSTVADVLNLL